MKMMKAFFKKLSNYPRLRILLLIVLIVTILILVGNLVGSSASKEAPPLPPSQVLTPKGIPKPVISPLTTQEYQALEKKEQAQTERHAIQAGQTVLPNQILAAPMPQQAAKTELQSQRSPAITPQHAISSPKPVASSAPETTPVAPEPSAQTVPTTSLDYAALVKQADQTAETVATPSTPHAVSTGPTAPSGEAVLPQVAGAASSSQTASNGAYQVTEAALQRAILMRENTVAFKDRQVLQDNTTPQAMQSLTTAMQNQMQSLSGHWSFHRLSTESASLSQQTVSKAAAPKTVVITAGTVYYGVLMTAVDSDQPSAPILAKVVSGPYNGAKLLGGFKLEGERLVVQFTSMTLPHMDHSIAISAYAIDGVTAQNALASNVDHHYLYRYGSLFAAAFLEGFGDAYSNWDPCAYGVTTCTIIGNNIAPSPTTTQEAIYRGLGQVGTTMGQQIAQNFNTPPTVTLNQGIGIGVLFMQDVSV